MAWEILTGVSIRARPRGRATSGDTEGIVSGKVSIRARPRGRATHEAEDAFGDVGVSIRARPRGRATAGVDIDPNTVKFQSARVLADARPVRVKLL